MTYLEVWVFLMMSNIIYHVLGKQNWNYTFDRCYFQTIAVFVCWFVVE